MSIVDDSEVEPKDEPTDSAPHILELPPIRGFRVYREDGYPDLAVKAHQFQVVGQDLYIMEYVIEEGAAGPQVVVLVRHIIRGWHHVEEQLVEVPPILH